jgi:hydrogenase maturation protein HypF
MGGAARLWTRRRRPSPARGAVAAGAAGGGEVRLAGMEDEPPPRREGRLIRVRGQVQGVGFRPFVWLTARALGLDGDVRNDAGGVAVRAAGPPAALDALTAALRDGAPPLARVEAVEAAPLDPAGLGPGFAIAATEAGAPRTRVAPDAAICPACRDEILDPAARRRGHAFANCTHCGPRFSILRSIPYDRASTTMAAFPMCAACRAEYENPADRRFHAQPVACPDCGPRLWLERDGGREDADPIGAAAALLRAGAIVAVKGLGGFHLATDARSEAAVARLRARKRRPTKPLAVMVGDVAEARRHAAASEDEAALLGSAAAPVVLLRSAGEPLAPSVAPGRGTVGVMLAATPLHVLLLRAFGGPLVMTSANVSGAPMETELEGVRARLGDVADAFLAHDRPIARRLDDGVARVVAGAVRWIRRARGCAPQPLALPPGLAAAPPVLAAGGDLKAALCLTRDGAALLTQHLGDLDDPRTFGEWERAADDAAALFDHAPAAVACDPHPGYRSTAWARARAAAAGLPLVEVQHHHAHVAAAMAEHGWPPDGPPVLGVALDGLGWGGDGTLWGGELLLCRYDRFQRVAWLRPAPLPGGDAAAREPWRCLFGRLTAAGIDPAPWLPGRPLATLAAMVAKGLNAPLSSSAGRLFDAAACAAGVAPDRQTHEGEAAAAIEAAAYTAPGALADPYPFGEDGPAVDPAPMWRALLADRVAEAPAGVMAARFHAGLAAALADRAAREADRGGAGAIAVTGGVAQNALLLDLMLRRLGGRRVLVPSAAPAGDGGLALGQAAAAAARLSAGR